MELTTGVRVLMGQIADYAHKMGFSASRVDVPRHPEEWGPPSTFDKREAARVARHQRG
jgi:hypothetical protein